MVQASRPVSPTARRAMVAPRAAARALALAAALVAVAAQDEYLEPLPEDGVADTEAHVEVPMALPEGAVSALADNATTALALRAAVASTAGDSGSAHFATIMAMSGGVGGAEYDFTALYGVNTYDGPTPEGEAVRRRMRARLLALREAAAAAAAAGGRRLEAAAPAPNVLVWYMYGLSFTMVAESRNVDGVALAATMAAGLTAADTYAPMDASGACGSLGMTPSQLAAAVDPAGVTVTLPRLRYQPFGSIEASAMGSYIGIGVFVLAVAFIALPSAFDYARKHSGWRRVATQEGGAGAGGGDAAAAAAAGAAAGAPAPAAAAAAV